MLNSPRLLNLPLLLLANKQDVPSSLSTSEIRQSYENFQRNRSGKPEASASSASKALPKPQRRLSEINHGEDAVWDDGGAAEERLASLDVMGVSALQG